MENPTAKHTGVAVIWAENIQLREKVEQVQVENERYKAALAHIIEYWNGSDNYRATADALEEIIETARQARKGGEK